MDKYMICRAVITVGVTAIAFAAFVMVIFNPLGISYSDMISGELIGAVFVISLLAITSGFTVIINACVWSEPDDYDARVLSNILSGVFGMFYTILYSIEPQMPGQPTIIDISLTMCIAAIFVSWVSSRIYIYVAKPACKRIYGRSGDSDE